MVKLCALTGQTMSGKTTTARQMLKMIPGAEMVPSYCINRDQRPDDIPGEYEYLTETQFQLMVESGECLWTASHGKSSYLTRRDSLLRIWKKKDALGIMILVPSVYGKLLAFLKEYGLLGDFRAFSFSLLSPEELNRRYLKRGKMDDIEKRLMEARINHSLVKSIDHDFTELDSEAALDENMRIIRHVLGR